jgi:arsenate reductase
MIPVGSQLSHDLTHCPYNYCWSRYNDHPNDSPPKVTSLKVQILHNPRCSKSRATLQLLNDRDLNPEVILYLEAPPDTAFLNSILRKLDMNPRDLMRKGQSEYKEMELANKQLSDADLIAAMIEAPILIERPIVLANGKAAIGRPPESVLDLL